MLCKNDIMALSPQNAVRFSLYRIFCLLLVLPPPLGFINLRWGNINRNYSHIDVRGCITFLPSGCDLTKYFLKIMLDTILTPCMSEQIMLWIGHKQLSREDEEMSALNICVRKHHLTPSWHTEFTMSLFWPAPSPIPSPLLFLWSWSLQMVVWVKWIDERLQRKNKLENIFFLFRADILVF